jgi:hypothetical protein
LGENRFTYRISDGELDSGIATVTLVVALSGEKETGDHRPGKSATITLHSTLAPSPAPEPERYLILRGKRASTPQPETPDQPRIDWNGVAPVIAVAPLWLPAFLSKKENEEEELSPQRLAEITGLRFPMEPSDRQGQK